MALYSPNVQTISGPNNSTTNPLVESYQNILGRYQRPVQLLPVMQPGFIQYAPEPAYDRGWEQHFTRSINPPPSIAIVPRVQAPEVEYTLRTYGSLVYRASEPYQQPRRKAVQVSAPGINQQLPEF